MGRKPPRLSLERIERATVLLAPELAHTPQFCCDSLSEALGLRLLVKVETVNPLRCFKGRGAHSLAQGLGPDDRHLVCASAGNFGLGLAYALRDTGVGVTVYASVGAEASKIRRLRSLGATVVLHGEDLDAAKIEARSFADRAALRFVEDGREPAISEGAGTIGVELDRWRGALDAVVVPVGNGALLAGVSRVLRSRRPACHIAAVGAVGAPAMIRSIRDGRVRETERVSTIADGLAVRLPIPEAVDDLRGGVDSTILVSDEAIGEAIGLAHRHLGLLLEPAGAAGLAAAASERERFAGRTVATILTGGNTTYEQVRDWLS